MIASPIIIRPLSYDETILLTPTHFGNEEWKQSISLSEDLGACIP
jgi:hypothetical protein